MAISGDMRVSATLGAYPGHALRSTLAPSKVDFSGFLSGASGGSDISMRRHSRRPLGITGEYKLPPNPIAQEMEMFLLNVVNMSFIQRVNLAWKIIFPAPASRKNSNAHIAKQRLKMILFSDRCAVSDEAKQKIVSNIVNALSEFVEIESQDNVQLSVSTDSGLGTIYSVTVPVRRVKPEYQGEADEVATITNIEYKDKGESSGSVDVRFDFYVPDEKLGDFGV